MAMEGNGIVKEYVGGYDDWVRQSKNTPVIQQQPEKATCQTNRAKTNSQPAA